MDDNGMLDSSWKPIQVSNFFEYLEITDEDKRKAYWECVEEEIKDEIKDALRENLPLSDRAIAWVMEEF